MNIMREDARGRIEEINSSLTDQIQKRQRRKMIRRQINDTEVPCLDTDLEKIELCFDWKGLYTAFFREERERRRRMKAIADIRRAPFGEIKEKGRGGNIDILQAIGNLVSLWINGDSKNVRRDLEYGMGRACGAEIERYSKRA